MPVANRAKQTTTTQTDALPYSLDASIPSGFISFVQAMTDISGVAGPWPVSYVCEGALGQWEEGFGTLTDGVTDTVSRDVILRSSSGFGVAVNWGSGTRTIWIAPLAQDLYSLFKLLSTGGNGLLNKTATRTLALVTLGSAAAALLDDNTTAAQRATLGASAVGDAVFVAASTLAARNAIGATTVGNDMLTAATQAAGRSAIGATALGSDLFVAASAAAARTLLGSTTVGDAVFIAATAAAARSALGLDPFISSAQTITAGGLLTLPHLLGVKPSLVIARLTCVSTDQDFDAGDTVELGAGTAASENQNRGHAIRTDATNIYVRFASGSGTTYQVPNKDTGNTGDIDNNDWTIQFIAFR